MKNLNNGKQIKKFPLEVFPQWLQKMIQEYHSKAQFPMSYTAMSIISAIAGTMGKAYYLNIGNDWHEYPILYCMLVGPNGARKTPPMKLALKPSFKINDDAIETYNLQMEGWEEGTKRPTNGQYIFQDTTFESLIDVLKNNGGTYHYFADEIISLFEKLAKDSDSMTVADMLKFWNGGAYSKNRRSDNFVTNIKHVVPNILGSTQNGEMRTLFPRKYTSNGFFQRWLFVIEHTRCFTNFENDAVIDPDYITKYTNLIHTIYSVRSKGGSKQLLYSSEAKEVLKRWGRIQNEYRRNADSDIIDGVYAKLEYYFHRFALIFQIILMNENQGNDHEINVKAAECAATLVEYFRHQSTLVCDILDSAVALDKITVTDKKIFPHLPSFFRYSEAAAIVKEKIGIGETTFGNSLVRLIDAGLIKKSGTGYIRERKKI